MKEKEQHELMDADILAIATKYSATRLKISTLNFDRDFQRGEDGGFYLVSEKAIIRALGKTSKVPIGVDEKYKTFEEAEEGVKKYWSEYYRNIRANRSQAERKAEARRQKAYRERRKERDTELKRQQ